MSEFTENGATPLAYRTWGSPAGLPLLLLHGFMGCGDDWETVAAGLSDRFHCIAPDLPGHGRTRFDASCHTTFSTYAHSVIVLMDRLGLSSVSAVGYSMGGRVLLALALKHPDRFTRLMLESATAGIDDAAARAARWRSDRAVAERLRRDDLETFLAWWYDQPIFGAIKACPGYHAMRQRRLRNNPGPVAHALAAVSQGRQPSLWSHLATLQPAALLVYGEQDAAYRAVTQRMVGCSDRFRVVAARACSHAVHVEQPEAFIEMCRTFFDKTQQREERA